MTTKQEASIQRFIRKVVDQHRDEQASDRDLLRRFAQQRDEDAFATLLRRHSAMVLGVGLRVLHHHPDAEDVCQATFLLLAQKAKAVPWRDSVANWLYGVAYRLALQARDAACRRNAHEIKVKPQPPPDALADITLRDLQTVLDEELARLPKKYSAPLILCCLEGKARDEAAQCLGWPLATVKCRLEEGRELLRRRLVRRGLTLSATLAGVTLTSGMAQAALPATLARATSRAALQALAGRTVAGVVSANVMALIKGGGQTMLLTKLKVATAFLLAAGVLTAGIAALAQLAPVEAARAQSPAKADSPRAPNPKEKPSPDAKAAEQPAAAPGEDRSGTVAYRGRVLDPDGKPVSGARVYYHFITREDESTPVRTTTDAEGRFSFTLTRKDVPLSADATQSDPLRTGQVVVKADGFTFAWAAAPKQPGDLSLQLAADDAPVEGRIVDLQGKPIAGLRVSALSVAAPETGDLSPFVKALESSESLHAAFSKHVTNHLHNPIIGRTLAGFLPVTTTDADGQFRLRGFAKERLIELRVEGPAIETQNLFVLTRARPAGSGRVLTPARVKDPLFGPDASVLVFWNGFDHAVAPGQTVTGTVRDESTRRPIPGAIVESYMLAGTNLGQNTIYATVADGEGRYQFTGLPRGKGNRIRIRPPKDQAYIPVVKDVPATETFARATVDAALTPGVWVDVTVTDRGSGQPVPGYVSYFVLPEKWDAASRFTQPHADAYNNVTAIRNDGTFRFVAVPQKAIVAFRADWAKYPIAREASTIRLPSGLSPSNFQAFAEINPKLGDRPVQVAFTLDTGRVVKGTVLGPAGRPLGGALAAGLRHDWYTDAEAPLRTTEFTALGLHPARPRLLCFAHPDKKLAGSVVVRGDEKEPILVKLQPWAAVSGRLLDGEGKPIKNARLKFVSVPICKPDQTRPLDTGLHVVYRSAYQPNEDPKTDAEGRFRIERLIPGLKYNLALYDADGAVDFTDIKWTGLAFANLILKPGETKDLGDVKLQPFPKE